MKKRKIKVTSQNYSKKYNVKKVIIFTSEGNLNL